MSMLNVGDNIVVGSDGKVVSVNSSDGSSGGATQMGDGYLADGGTTRTVIWVSTRDRKVKEVDTETHEVVEEKEIPEEAEYVAITGESELVFVSEDQTFTAPVNFIKVKDSAYFWVCIGTSEDTSDGTRLDTELVQHDISGNQLRQESYKDLRLYNWIAVNPNGEAFGVTHPDRVLKKYPGNKTLATIDAFEVYDGHWWNGWIVFAEFGPNDAFIYSESGQKVWTFKESSLYADGWLIKSPGPWAIESLLQPSTNYIHFVLRRDGIVKLARLSKDLEFELYGTVDLADAYAECEWTVDIYGNVYFYSNFDSTIDSSGWFGLGKYNANGILEWYRSREDYESDLSGVDSDDAWIYALSITNSSLVAHGPWGRYWYAAFSLDTGQLQWLRLISATSWYSTGQGTSLGKYLRLLPGSNDVISSNKDGSIDFQSDLGPDLGRSDSLGVAPGVYEVEDVNSTSGDGDSELPSFYAQSTTTQTTSASVYFPSVSASGSGTQTAGAGLALPVLDTAAAAEHSISGSAKLPSLQAEGECVCKTLVVGEASISFPSLQVSAEYHNKAQITSYFPMLESQVYSSSPGNRIRSTLPRFNGVSYVTAGETGATLESALPTFLGALFTGLVFKESLPSLSGQVGVSVQQRGNVEAEWPGISGSCFTGSHITEHFPALSGSCEGYEEFSAVLQNAFFTLQGTLSGSTLAEGHIAGQLPSFKSSFKVYVGVAAQVSWRLPNFTGQWDSHVLQAGNLTAQWPKLQGQMEISIPATLNLQAAFPVLTRGMFSRSSSSTILRHVRNEVN